MESTGTSGGMRPRCPFGRAWTTTLFYVAFLGSIGLLNSQSRAQEECGMTTATPLRVENATGVDMLRAAATCTGGGSLQADWAGAITLDTPISIASGMSLSITGEDTLAEVRGGYQTRMFEVFPGGRLTLTQLKLSGGNETSGGAIYSNTSALILDSCVFHDNVATDGDGGAVWAYGSNVTILGGGFLDNNASQYGGAVAAMGISSSLVVEEGSTFQGNKALVGGALYCSGVAESGLLTICSLSDTLFTSNTATGQTEETASFLDPSEGVDGGGAVAFLFAAADITGSVFVGNHAQFSGGAVLGGNGTDITANGCKFENNTAVEHGGAIAAASMSLGGDTQLSDNKADEDGGAVFGWDSSGTIVFNDVSCTQNLAIGNGGCFFTTGRSSVQNGTVMHDNNAGDAGCIYGYDGCEINVFGGDFRCQAERRAGFLYGSDQCRVTISGGLIANCGARRKAGAIYSGGTDGSLLLIEGGLFVNNTSLESGGAIVLRSASTLMKITGGTFTNNSATLYGGFVSLDELSSFTCEGATISGNTAGNEGGGVYARDATWVNSSCNFIANQAPQGAAFYLAGCKNVTLNNHAVTDNLAFSGSVLYSTESSVVATGVTFMSGLGLQEDSANRAVQTVTKSALTLTECVFDGWLGDAVIYHTTSDADSLHLDSCDFRASSASMAVFSLNSDANIRNAVVGDLTFANAGTLNNSMALVNRALDCSSPDVCGPGECVDSILGVLCQCLDVDSCLDGGGELSLAVTMPPAGETFSPESVTFELVVTSAGNGTTHAIWNLDFESKYLNVAATPSSGILPPGGTHTVYVTGTPATQDVGGHLTSSFYLASVGDTNSSSTARVQKLEVTSTFFLCSAFEYAKPLPNETNGVSCEQCTSIYGGEGVDCENPGATLASLPILEGYWRWSRESVVVHQCLNSKACSGRTEVSSADDYCQNGYKGPYCAVCSKGYGRGVSNTCHSCDNAKGRLLTTVGVLVSVVVLLLLTIFAMVFLIGGLDAVHIVRQSVTRNASKASDAPFSRPLPQNRIRERACPERRARTGCQQGTLDDAFDVDTARQRFAGDYNAGHSSNGSPSTSPGPGVAEGANSPWPAADVPAVGTGVGLSEVPGGQGGDGRVPTGRHDRTSTVVDGDVKGAPENGRKALKTDGDGKNRCWSVGQNVKRWVARLPLDKLKILVVVWQIVTVSSGITGIEYPAVYSRFLAGISVVNLDIGRMISASCILPSVNFYIRLLVTTLTPLVLAAGLLVTYQLAKRRADRGSAGVVARKAAWARHVAAGLLLTFLVFTSASALAFETFACDDEVGDGDSYLRADYSLSCKTDLHFFFKGYALLMILVYPIGVPVMYGAMLWRKRDLLNPRVHAITTSEPDQGEEKTTTAEAAGAVRKSSRVCCAAPRGKIKSEPSPQELQEVEERVRARAKHPELAPTIFLWKDFAPVLFYYEAIECLRRVLLTGILVFIAPNHSTQTGIACIFAFVSLLGFELMRPHLDPTDVWLYRLGCVIIFLTNFLALLIKVDAAGEDNRSTLGGLLVAVNVLLAVAVISTSCFAVQQSVDDSRSKDNDFNVATAMFAAERGASQIIRSTRELSATDSSAAFSATHEIPPLAPSGNRRDAGSSRSAGGTGGAILSEDTILPGKVRSPLP